MTGHDLIEALAKTGTGARKLDNAREYLSERPNASAAEMTAALEAQGRDLKAHGAGWPLGTADKARALLNGTSLTDLIGKPPPMSEESKEHRLVKEIFEKLKEGEYVVKHSDKQAEIQGKGVGNPKALKPAKLEE